MIKKPEKKDMLQKPNDNADIYLNSKVQGYNQAIEEYEAFLPSTEELLEIQRIAQDEYYNKIQPQTKAGSLLGDGWTLPIIKHILKYMK